MTNIEALAYFLVGFALGIVCRPAFKLFVKPNTPIFSPPKLHSWRRVGHDYELVFDDGNAYRGDCTVWHHYPSGERADTSTESWLCDVWQRIKWKEQEQK